MGEVAESVAMCLSVAPMCRHTHGVLYTRDMFCIHYPSHPSFLANPLSAGLSALYHPNMILGCSKGETHHKSQDWLEPGELKRKWGRGGRWEEEGVVKGHFDEALLPDSDVEVIFSWH